MQELVVEGLTIRQVYERGVASIGISVDLWANYCNFKTETSHDIDVTRE
jgi:pre-mRNA-processing factor 39